MKAKIPTYIKYVFFNQVWKIPNNEKKIYLTFDDGPIPEVTPWVLEQLNRYEIKATFFCIGDNIRKYPEVFDLIIKNGHQVANHSFNHIKGWETRTTNYIKNVIDAEEIIEKYCDTSKKLFRPPYGKIKPIQSYRLRKLKYKIIMWDVLSLDYNKENLPEQCVNNVLENVSSGSIIVFHDSLKASKNLYESLPIVIESLKKEGYIFEVLS